MSIAAGAAAGEGAGEVADAAADSRGFNALLVVAALAVAYGVYKWMNIVGGVAEDGAEGVGGAGRAAGDFAGGVADWAGGTVADGATDVARGGGNVVGNLIGSAGEIANDTAGGAADVVDALNPTTEGPVVPGVVLW